MSQKVPEYLKLCDAYRKEADVVVVVCGVIVAEMVAETETVAELAFVVVVEQHMRSHLYLSRM